MITNTIITGDCAAVMADMPAKCVDLVITSPPYDNLRDYHGYSFDFPAIAAQLARVLKQGGVIVWVVGDATINGGETLTSLRQAIHFVDACGLIMHDTMIYEKASAAWAAANNSNRYTQIWEYAFVLAKGKPKTTNLIADRPNISAGSKRNLKYGRNKSGAKIKSAGYKIGDQSIRNNIWRYGVGGGRVQHSLATNHPATMPLALAADHIKTWSNPGDVVLDPFSGSGTTAIAAAQLARKYIAIDISADYNALAARRVDKEVGKLLQT